VSAPCERVGLEAPKATKARRKDLSDDDYRIRVPHPFAFFVKGWKTRMSAGRMFESPPDPGPFFCRARFALDGLRSLEIHAILCPQDVA
jgi:hypothetical protein